MTKQTSKNELNIPEIIDSEDTPFPPKSEKPYSKSIDSNLGQQENIDDELLRFKYRTGRNVLYVAMIAMLIFVIIELITKRIDIESNLITSAFEAFKLIAMTAIGYILGTNVSK